MNEGNNNKPKLEFEINNTVRLKLLQDKPATGTSQYGPWFLYNVESEGQEYSMFCPEPVQKFIETEGLGKGDTIEITKTVTKYGNKKMTNFKCSLVEKAPAPVVPANSNNGTAKPDDVKIMRECLIAAIDLQKELGSVVDVNRVALSLYISKTKNGNSQF